MKSRSKPLKLARIEMTITSKQKKNVQFESNELNNICKQLKYSTSEQKFRKSFEFLILISSLTHTHKKTFEKKKFCLCFFIYSSLD
jgi:hypothetical protein